MTHYISNFLFIIIFLCYFVTRLLLRFSLIINQKLDGRNPSGIIVTGTNNPPKKLNRLWTKLDLENFRKKEFFKNSKKIEKVKMSLKFFEGDSNFEAQTGNSGPVLGARKPQTGSGSSGKYLLLIGIVNQNWLGWLLFSRRGVILKSKLITKVSCSIKGWESIDSSLQLTPRPD